MEEVLNVSPIDGRYAKKTRVLSPYFSEFALIKNRTVVEIKWLLFLADKKFIDESISPAEREKLLGICKNFSLEDAKRVKEIEATTNHDVKAVEYFLREKFDALDLGRLNPFIHITLTSEDVNNTSYNLMLSGGLNDVYVPALEKLILKLHSLADEYAGTAMLGHTHGQVATPTTVGKEFKVFEYRLKVILNRLKQIKLTSKFSGAVGNFNAHVVAYPKARWVNIASEFVNSLGLEYNPVTTQIESHDTICLILSHIKILNNIVKDLNSDMWLYISKNYFNEKLKSGEVGSSVMPHKVNPINHENSMANVELSNGLIDALVNNLSISRLQRDLSDSSKMRNLGVIFAHSLISLTETLRGLDKLEVNSEVITADLEANFTVLAEAIQTVLRKNKVQDAYEKLKALSRGKNLTQSDLQEFVSTLQIPESDKQKLMHLTPETYTGLAEQIVKDN